MKYQTPDGAVMFLTGTCEENKEQIRKIEARWKFCKEYAKQRNWPEDFKKLSISQILEIREQDGWINP